MHKTKPEHYRSQRGAALPLVLVSILFLTLLGFLAMTTSSIEVRLAANERDYQQAVYAAEAGVAHTRAVLKDLLNVCNQTNIAAGGDVNWNFVLVDNPADCPALAGQSRPLTIQANLDRFRYMVAMTNNTRDDPSGSATDDQDQRLVVTSLATGPLGVRAGVEVILVAENSDSEVSGYSGQYGAGSGKNFSGRDARAITNTASSNLGNL